jgi:4-hydroxybenzoate polyprenyltransferase
VEAASSHESGLESAAPAERAGKTGGAEMIRAWLELLRAPNLFTVPGDVLAGFFLACGTGAEILFPEIALLLGASISIYAAGLLLNDFFDRAADARERPGRPIPSGRVRPGTVLAVAVSLELLALVLAYFAGTAALAAAAALIALSFAYDAFLKRVPVVGIAVMGLCRAGNLLLGASAFPPAMTVQLGAAMIAEFAYITAVSAIAKNETARIPPAALRFAPPLFAAAGLAAVCAAAGFSPIALAVSIAAVAIMVSISVSIKPDGPVDRTPRAVGAFLRALIFLQCAFVIAAAPDRMIPAAAILMLWPFAWIAGRRFHGS